MLPNADYLYACDRNWWDIHLEDVKKTFKGKLYTQWHRNNDEDWAKANGITAIQGSHNKGLGREMLHFNANSGAQAINLAYLLGAGRIFLLGYDMGATGRTHWFGDHPKGLTTGNYSGFVENFTRLASDLREEGVEVINFTRQTALHQFKRADIDDYPGFCRVQ